MAVYESSSLPNHQLNHHGNPNGCWCCSFIVCRCRSAPPTQTCASLIFCLAAGFVSGGVRHVGARSPDRNAATFQPFVSCNSSASSASVLGLSERPWPRRASSASASVLGLSERPRPRRASVASAASATGQGVGLAFQWPLPPSTMVPKPPGPLPIAMPLPPSHRAWGAAAGELCISERSRDIAGRLKGKSWTMR